MTSPSVSKWAGTVWLDEHGRPWVTNKSGVHDLFVRRWPHALPEKLARNIGETQIDPNRRMLTEGWWWVNTGRGASCGWLLVSVEAVRRRSTHTPGATGAFRVPLESEQTLAPEARPVYRLPDDLVDTFVGYFADWFAVPPKLAPRIRTGKEVEDVGDNRRNRILTALKADIHGAQGRRGQLNTNLLIRAIDEGKLTFRAVYERVIDDDRSI